MRDRTATADRSRTMISTLASPRWARVVLSVLVALAVAGSAAAADPPGSVEPLGTGLWLYNTAMSITVYNLTNYTLVSPSNSLVRHGGCSSEESLPLQGLNAAPYRTWANVYYLNFRPVDPCSYSGAVEVKAQGAGNTLSPWSFDLAFETQHAAGLAESGSWIWLRPHSSDQRWSTAAGSKVHGRYVTPAADLQMHNIMTLVGDTCMVSLYSPDNINVVIVVQQYEENATGWHNADDYQGWKLDWVDNGSIYVPGQ